MIRYNLSAKPTPEFTCDHCQNEIPEKDVVLMRESCALPEEPAFHVHQRCVDRFPSKKAGSWQRISLASQDAGWFV